MPTMQVALKKLKSIVALCTGSNVAPQAEVSWSTFIRWVAVRAGLECGFISVSRRAQSRGGNPSTALPKNQSAASFTMQDFRKWHC